jgi:hypothetical protein
MHELDRLIHERLRLGIISARAVNDSLTFKELKHMVKTSDGNLSVHARKLEDCRLCELFKTFRWPHTKDRVLPDDMQGGEQLERYLDHMEAVIDQMPKTSRLIKIFCGRTLLGKALCPINQEGMVMNTNVNLEAPLAALALLGTAFPDFYRGHHADSIADCSES